MGSGWGTAGLGRWHVRLDRHIWGWDGRMGLGGHTWGGNAWICGVGVEAHGIGMDGYVGLGWSHMGLDGQTWDWMDTNGVGRDTHGGEMDTWGWDECTWG